MRRGGKGVKDRLIKPHWQFSKVRMRSVEPLSAISIIRASYAFVPKAVLPGVMGTVMFVLLSLLGRFLRSTALFGAASSAVAVAILLCFSVLWFAMTFRAGLGLSRARYILALGKQELSLGVSLLGFAFVLGVIGVLIGFLVFLLVMMLAAIGGGALSGADVAGASIFETPEAFRAFLSGTGTGQIIGVLGLSVLISAVLFLFWLVVRLAPFAAAAVQQADLEAQRAGCG